MYKDSAYHTSIGTYLFPVRGGPLTCSKLAGLHRRWLYGSIAVRIICSDHFTIHGGLLAGDRTCLGAPTTETAALEGQCEEQKVNK